MITLAHKMGTTEENGQEQSFGGEIAEKRPQTRKSILGSSLGEGELLSSATNNDRTGKPDAELREILNCQNFSSENKPKEI
jgi:hypothetical protein